MPACPRRDAYVPLTGDRMVASGTADIAAQLLRSFLSEELGATAPLLSLLCTMLGEQTCGSMGKQLKHDMRAASADGAGGAAD